MERKKVEIIVQSLEDAINAQRGGASRLEIVSELSEGGLTPSIAMVKSIIENTNIELAVMVRPTSKTFCYKKQDLELMKKDAEIFQEMGIKRIVIGILDSENNIDVEALNYVLENIEVDVTFHRAIDESKDIFESIKVLNRCEKVSHILTSGGYGNAKDNLDTIKKMIELSEKKIMLASGLNLDVLEDIKKSILIKDKKYDVHFGRFAQDKYGVVSEEKVKQIVDAFYSK